MPKPWSMLDNWIECIANACEEHGVTATSEQIEAIARDIQVAHECELRMDLSKRRSQVITVMIGNKEMPIETFRKASTPPANADEHIILVLCDALEAKHAQLRAAAVELDALKAQIIEIDKGSLCGIMNNWGSLVSLAKQAEDGRG